LPARSPNLNASAERFSDASVGVSGADVCFGGSSLCRAVDEFVTHYNQEQNHQVLANQLIQSEAILFPSEGRLCGRKRLGGLLNYYQLLSRSHITNEFEFLDTTRKRPLPPPSSD
jgi:hypothetical protein